MKNYFMDKAYEEAIKSYKMDEIPVGCVIVKDNKIISSAHNCKECSKNSIMHAELLAVDSACKAIGDWRLDGCEIYTTLEPCMMCMGAIIESRIKTVYYGTKSNSKHLFDIDKVKNDNINVFNVNDPRCSEILRDFFKNRRKN